MVLGQLIISPESLARSLDEDGNRVKRSQNRIQRSSETIPIVVLPTSDEDIQGQKHDEYFRANSTPSSLDRLLGRNDNVQKTSRTQSSMREMSPFVASRKSEMNEVIDTVCLQSGTWYKFTFFKKPKFYLPMFKYNIICHVKFCIVPVLNRVVQLNVITVQGLHLKGFVRKWIRNILDSPLINLVTRYSFYSCNLYLRPFLSGYFSDWKSYDDIKRLCKVHGHGFKHYG